MRFKVVGIGELLWDLLPGGRHLGGAPGNFVYHARSLGADAGLISRIGADDLGREALAQLRALGVPTDGIQTDVERPTGTVSVTLSADGQPQFVIHEAVAWDALKAVAVDRVREADAVCFGTLAQRCELSRLSVQALVAASRLEALRIFDINLRQHFYSREVIEDSLALANVLKLNETELPRLAEMFELSGDDRAQMVQLVERFRLRAVAYTRGGRGSVLYAAGEWSEHPGQRVEVVDTVGAGDAFTAAMALGLLAGWRLDVVHARASSVAAFVCSQAGATPVLPEELRAGFWEAQGVE